MPIQPASSGRPNPSDGLAGKSPVEGSPRVTRARSNAAGETSDRIELSEISRELAEHIGAARVPAGEVPADRLRGIAARLAAGHYDRPDVREAVLDRLLASR